MTLWRLLNPYTQPRCSHEYRSASHCEKKFRLCRPELRQYRVEIGPKGKKPLEAIGSGIHLSRKCLDGRKAGAAHHRRYRRRARRSTLITELETSVTTSLGFVPLGVSAKLSVKHLISCGNKSGANKDPDNFSRRSTCTNARSFVALRGLVCCCFPQDGIRGSGRPIDRNHIRRWIVMLRWDSFRSFIESAMAARGTMAGDEIVYSAHIEFGLSNRCGVGVVREVSSLCRYAVWRSKPSRWSDGHMDSVMLKLLGSNEFIADDKL